MTPDWMELLIINDVTSQTSSVSQISKIIKRKPPRVELVLSDLQFIECRRHCESDLKKPSVQTRQRRDVCHFIVNIIDKS